jgi:energy-coupling factor transporter ATP-binding protein EcfA2
MQRVALARVLYSRDAKIIFLDDPFSALDARVALQVAQFVQTWGFKLNKTVIFTCSRPELVMSHKRLRMEEGHVREVPLSSQIDLQLQAPLSNAVVDTSWLDLADTPPPSPQPQSDSAHRLSATMNFVEDPLEPSPWVALTGFLGQARLWFILSIIVLVLSRLANLEAYSCIGAGSLDEFMKCIFDSRFTLRRFVCIDKISS